MVTLLLLLMFAPVFPQERADAPSKPPKRGDIVIARGCLKAGMLESADLGKADGAGRNTELFTYRLTGDKKTLQAIRKEHDGHSDTITGELKTDLPTTAQPHGKRIGNTRITVGVGSSRIGTEPPPPMPVLRVTSFEHTGVTCR